MDPILELRDGNNLVGAPVGGGLPAEDVGELANPLGFDGEGFCGFAVKGTKIYRLRFKDENPDGFSSRLLLGSSQYDYRANPLVVYVSDIYTPTIIEDTYTISETTQFVYDAGIVLSDQYMYVIGFHGKGPNILGYPVVFQVGLADKSVRILQLPNDQVVLRSFRGLVWDLDAKKMFVLIDAMPPTTAFSQRGLAGYSDTTAPQIWELDEESLVITGLITAGGAAIRLVAEADVNIAVPGSDDDVNVKLKSYANYVKDGYMWGSAIYRQRTQTYNYKWVGLAVWEWHKLDDYQADNTTQVQVVDLKTGRNQWPNLPQIDVGKDIAFPFATQQHNYDRVFCVCVDEGLVWMSYLANADGAISYDRRDMHTWLIRYDISHFQADEVVDETGPSAIIVDDNQGAGIVLDFEVSTTLPITHRTVGTIPVSAQTGGTIKVVDVGARFPNGSGVYFFRPAPTGLTTSNPTLFAYFGGYGILRPGTDNITVRYTLPDGTHKDIPVRINVSNPPPTPTQHRPAVQPVFQNTPYEFTLDVREPVGRQTPLRVKDALRQAFVRASPVRRYQWADSDTGHLFELDTNNGTILWRGVRELQVGERFSFVVQALNYATDRTQTVTDALVVVEVVGRNYQWPIINTHWLPDGYTKDTNGVISNDTDFAGNYTTLDISNLVSLGTRPRQELRWNVVVGDDSIADVAYSETSDEGTDFITFIGKQSGTTTFDIQISDGQVPFFTAANLSLTWALTSGHTASNVKWYGGAPIAEITSLDVSGTGRLPSRLLSLTNPLFIGFADITHRNYSFFTEQGSDIITVRPTNRNLQTTIGGQTVMLNEVELLADTRRVDRGPDSPYDVVVSAATEGGLFDGTPYNAGIGKLDISFAVPNYSAGGSNIRYVPPTRNLAWNPQDNINDEGIPVVLSKATDYSWTCQRNFGKLGWFVLDLDGSVKAGTQDDITFAVVSSDSTVGTATIEGTLASFVGVGATTGGATYTITATDGTQTITVAEVEVSYSPHTPTTSEIKLFYTYDAIGNWHELDTSGTTKLGNVDVHEAGWWLERFDLPGTPLAGLKYAIAWTEAAARPQYIAAPNSHIEFVVGTDAASASKTIDGKVVSVPVGPITIHDANSQTHTAYPIRFFYNAGTIAHDSDDPQDNGFTTINPTLVWGITEYVNEIGAEWTDAQLILHTSIDILPPARRNEPKLFDGDGNEIHQVPGGMVNGSGEQASGFEDWYWWFPALEVGGTFSIVRVPYDTQQHAYCVVSFPDDFPTSGLAYPFYGNPANAVSKLLIVDGNQIQTPAMLGAIVLVFSSEPDYTASRVVVDFVINVPPQTVMVDGSPVYYARAKAVFCLETEIV